MTIPFSAGHILILGAGCAGTLTANTLRRKLREEEWSITIIDKDDRHVYQPGLVLIPFGINKPDDIVQPRRKLLSKGIRFEMNKIKRIDLEKKLVFTNENKYVQSKYHYDKLIICTGLEPSPEEVDGLMKGWQKNIFDFYTLKGAHNLSKALAYFEGGKLVINVSEYPIKNNFSPLEFAFLADWFFNERGIRDKVEIHLVTPLKSLFFKPGISMFLVKLLEEKKINLTTGFDLLSVDYKAGQIISYKNEKIGFDLLVCLPLNIGSAALVASGLSMDEIGYVDTDMHTLKAAKFRDIYVLGDTGNLPIPKTVSSIINAGEALVNNLVTEINGEKPEKFYDGRSGCVIETGFNKAALIEFTYNDESRPREITYVNGELPLDLECMPFDHLHNRMSSDDYWKQLKNGL